MVRWLLRAEGVAVFAVGAASYVAAGGEPWLLLPLFFVPDISMLGYLGGPRLGAVTYNLAHTLVLPIILALTGWWLSQPLLLMAAGVTATHIGLDRTLGYGLKYPTSFQDTHLGRIGKQRGEGARQVG
ncbi:hypothetical protein BH24CHL8_BH24CHL8_09820 [soil metagenome]